MAPTISITAILREAGLRLLRTLVERAEPYADEAEYHIVQSYASLLQNDPDSISAALMAAQRELRSRDPANARWLDSFDELLSHGGEVTLDFAENLWRAYLLHLDSAAALLWEQYRKMQHNVMIETGRQLPSSWRDWLNFIQAFMGLVESHLFETNPYFQTLFLANEARILADITLAGAEVPERVHPPITFGGGEFDAAAMLTAYLDWCIQLVGRMNPQGYQHGFTPTLSLDEIFVPLRLMPLEAHTIPVSLVRYQAPPFREALSPGLRMPLDIADLDDEQSVAVSEALRENHRLLLLGESGAGKTILLQHLALEYARIALEDIAARGLDSDEIVQDNHQIPIFVPLGHYIERRDPDENLTSYIVRMVTGQLQGVVSSTLVHNLLEEGRCLILLDGLNEVVNDNQRRALAASVAAFADEWCEHGNRVIVSCHLEGYHAMSLPASFAGYVICPLDRSQIGLFLIKWLLALERDSDRSGGDDETSRRAQAQTLHLLRELTANQQLYDLAQNPLILRMLISIQQAGLRLPSQRVLLYESVADGLIREWRLPQRASQTPKVLERETLALLGELAYWLQAYRPTGTATDQEVRDILSRVWREQHLNAAPEDAAEAVEAFLAEVRHRNGVLAEVEPRRYGFVCHALQEYFAARHLVASFRMAARRIRAHLHDPRWEEIIVLAIGFIAQSSATDAAELVMRAILADDAQAESRGYEPSPYEDVLKRDLFLAARLLGEEIDVGAEVAQRVVEELARLWVSADRDSAGRFRLITDRVRRYSMKLDGMVAGQYAFQKGLAYLKADNETVRAYAIDMLTFWPTYSSEACEALADINPESAPTLVKLAMACALGRIQELSSRGYVALLALIRDADLRVREAAQNALKHSRSIPDVALRTWMDLLRGETPAKRRMGAKMLQDVGALPPLVIGELLRLLSDPNPDVREAVAGALSHAPNLPENALTSICRAIGDTHEEVQLAAIRALGRPVKLPQEVIDHLIMWTQAESPAIRRAAATALGASENDTDDVLRALERLMNDPVDTVRRPAVEMLAHKGHDDPRIAHLLTHAVSDSSYNVRIGLAMALREFKQPDQPIRMTILKLLSDTHVNVREAVLESVAQMENPGEEIIRHLTGLVRASDRTANEPVLMALAGLRRLPADTLITMIEMLPMVQLPVAEAILECIQAHMLTKAEEIAYPLLDVALGAPATLKPAVVDVLGTAIHAAGGILEVLLQLADEENAALQQAAIASLAHARKVPSHTVARLISLLGERNRDVRLAAAVTLAKLARTLPDLDLDHRQTRLLANTLYNLLHELPPRAAWETGGESQDEALYALNWIAYRMRPGRLQLPAGT
jgi:HEAT repeat protein